jgi:hypothetical protein
MRASTRRVAAPLILVPIALAACATLHATSVHRCIGEHGEIAFSETRCASGRDIAGTTDNDATTAPSTSRSPPEPRASASATCPATPDALRDRIAEAFARRDANTLAGVMRWDGVSGGAANARMRELVELTQQPLTGVDLGGEAIEASLGDEPAPPSATLLTVRTGGLASGESEHEFHVTQAGGCYWLDW